MLLRLDLGTISLLVAAYAAGGSSKFIVLSEISVIGINVVSKKSEVNNVCQYLFLRWEI